MPSPVELWFFCGSSRRSARALMLAFVLDATEPLDVVHHQLSDVACGTRRLLATSLQCSLACVLSCVLGMQAASVVSGHACLIVCTHHVAFR